MEEQGKINFPAPEMTEEPTTTEAQTAGGGVGTASGENPPNAVVGGGQQPYAQTQQAPQPNIPQYGAYSPNMQGAGYQMPYNGYPQNQFVQGQYGQQGGYRPAPSGAYPAQPNMPQAQRSYGYQQNAAGTGPGEYNYKASMNQYNHNGSYNGAGPGQYDYRTGQQSSQAQPSQQDTPRNRSQPYPEHSQR